MLMNVSRRGAIGCAAALALFFGAAFSQEPAGTPPVQVKIVDEKPVVLEGLGGIDPQPQIQAQGQGNMYLNLQKNNQRIAFMQTNFHFDGQVMFPGNPPGRLIVQNQALPPGKNKKPRTGFMCVCEIVSLSPYPSASSVPMIFRHFSRISWGTGAPPEPHTRRDRRSYFSTSGWFTTATFIVVMLVQSVHRYL